MHARENERSPERRRDREERGPRRGHLHGNHKRHYGGKHYYPLSKRSSGGGDGFRRHKYVLTCDVHGMFMQVLNLPEDRPFLQIWYRETPSDELGVWHFTRHAFGLSCSPFVAMEVVRQHALRFGNKWPSKIVLTNSMVDDVWETSDDPIYLRKAKEELEGMFLEMGMPIHKWGSNIEDLMLQIPVALHSKTLRLTELNLMSDNPAVKALGLSWEIGSDLLKFEIALTEHDPWTLLSMVSEGAKTFDLLGLIAPTTIGGKYLIQLAWREQLGWDTPVPEELKNIMSVYCSHQKKLKLIGIPQNIGSGTGRLVVFGDSAKSP